jgi:hypothetical protein
MGKMKEVWRKFPHTKEGQNFQSPRKYIWVITCRKMRRTKRVSGKGQRRNTTGFGEKTSRKENT